MFKVLVLQRYYNLNDRQVQYQIEVVASYRLIIGTTTDVASDLSRINSDKTFLIVCRRRCEDFCS